MGLRLSMKPILFAGLELSAFDKQGAFFISVIELQRKCCAPRPLFPQTSDGLKNLQAHQWLLFSLFLFLFVWCLIAAGSLWSNGGKRGLSSEGVVGSSPALTV